MPTVWVQNASTVFSPIQGKHLLNCAPCGRGQCTSGFDDGGERASLIPGTLCGKSAEEYTDIFGLGLKLEGQQLTLSLGSAP